MATNTTKLALTKPDGTDLVDIAVLNANADKIDAASGATICTSTTRPASPWNGQLILETDTNNFYVYITAGATWLPVGSAVVSVTKPTSAGKGSFWMDPDTMRVYIYYTDANSSQWVEVGGGSSEVPTTANATTRDTMYPSPVQGNNVFRNDLGAVETYYGLYNASTNPGGRDTAGWYVTNRASALVPVRPTSVTVGSGSASVNSLGVVSFSGATSITLDNIFTSNFRNYKMILNMESFSANNDLFGRMTSGGVESSTSNYHFAGHAMNTAATNGAWVNPAATQLHFSANAASYGIRSRLFVEIFDPAIAKPTNLFWSSMHDNGSTWTATTVGGTQSLSNAYDGFKLYVSAGNMTGSIRFYGIADK